MEILKLGKVHYFFVDVVTNVACTRWLKHVMRLEEAAKPQRLLSDKPWGHR